VSQELSGKVAIVTGGASGIGRATVELFVAEGAKVVIADVDAERGGALAEELGANAVFQKTNVANQAEVQALVDTAVSKFGGLHIMFNNAGIMPPTALRFLDLDFSDFRKVMEVNLLGVMMGSQFAARHMAKNGGGSIINTSSIAGIVAGYGFWDYRASKAAVANFSASIAIDLAEYNIRVNTIVPGHIRTEMASFAEPGMDAATADRLEKALLPVWMFNQPLKRQGRPIDVANAAMFLGSDRSVYITGTTVTVDGGVNAGDPVNHIQKFMDTRAAVLGG
jgi:NAD(P)-dependent dehydrogenase (short-subunit alcohol dehydrogenase family)